MLCYVMRCYAIIVLLCYNSDNNNTNDNTNDNKNHYNISNGSDHTSNNSHWCTLRCVLHQYNIISYNII